MLFLFLAMAMEDFTFKKEERLSQKKEIDLLFEKGKRFNVFPFSVIHYSDDVLDGNSKLKLLVGVPKKHFKKAVDRNKIKRRIREAYRLNRNDLKASLETNNTKILLAIIYNDSETIKYLKLEDKIISILNRLQHIYAETNQ